jgi:hypothetical protein
MLSKKYYVGIAKIFSDHINALPKDFVYEFADYLGRDNKHFDRDRFLEACGL